MKKIVLVTCGSRGDVQPILALALALKAGGCRVLLAAPPENAAFAAGYGCPFQALGSDFMGFTSRLPRAHTPGPALAFVRQVRKQIAIQFTELPEIVRGADLVLGAALVFGLPSVAEAAGVPYRFIATCPQLLRSGAHPAVGIWQQDLPGMLNRITWRISDLAGRLFLQPVINRWRRAAGLDPIREDAISHLLGRGVIVASDPVLGSIPADAGPACVQTGYIHLRQKEGIGERVDAFLAKGPPVIYAGFGSMPGRDLAGLVPTVIRAARRSGVRVIFPIDRGRLPYWEAGDCCFAGRLPHDRLFPGLAAVVHHGGAGTTATAAAAGVPQIVVPHVLDQHYWARRIHRLGLGPEPLRRSRLTQHRLAAAMRACLSDPMIRQRARRVAGEIRPADSRARAAGIVLSILTNHRERWEI